MADLPATAPRQHHPGLPHAHIIHALPGRLRLRLPRHRPEVLERVRHLLADHPSISHVEVDARTGSVLVLGAVEAELLKHLGAEKGLFNLAPPEALKPLEENMTAVLENADATVRRISGNRVGLLGLVVVMLGGLLVVQIGRGRFDVPAPTLMWYALSIIMMLRAQPAT